MELNEQPAKINQSRVLVTFLETKEIELLERGMSQQQAGDLRARLKTFAEDWDRPEAGVYDKR